MAAVYPSEVIPILAGMEFAASLHPVNERGGDIYVFEPVPQGLVLMIGDVSGKGTAAAAIAERARQAFHDHVKKYNQPDALLTAIHRSIYPELERSDTFITVFLLLLESHPARLTYVSAGHTTTLLWQAANSKVHPLRSIALPLGIRQNLDLSHKSYNLLPGDVLLLYSDGITEAENRQGRVLGQQALVDLLYAAHPAPVSLQHQAILQAVEYHTHSMPLRDDITLFMARVVPGKIAAPQRVLPFVYPAELGQVKELAKLIRWVADELTYPSVAAREKFGSELELAVSEITTNIIQHAYQINIHPGRIQGRLVITASGVTIDIIDSGRVYQGSEGSQHFQLHDPPLRGYGLQIARQLLDHCQYRRLPGRRNHWHLTKALPVREGHHYGYPF